MSDGRVESLLDADALVAAVKGKNIGKKQIFFSSVATDTRNVGEGSLFVPLIGEKQDGHSYIRSAVEKGASVVFAVESNWNSLPGADKEYAAANAAVVIVDNTLYALQTAAAAYVKKFPKLIKIGITGSNGKTTTKEVASSILSQKYNVIATEGNFNSETGLPLSVFKIRDCHEVGVFEMGMNRRNEIGELAGVLCPSFAIITNIGTAHIGILGSKDAIAEEKKKIFSRFNDDSCVGFVPGNDEYAAFLADIPVGHVQFFGPEYQKNITDVKSDGISGTSFSYCGVPVEFPLPGTYNFMDMLAVVALAEKLEVPADAIRKGIECVKPLFGRSRVIKGRFSVVQDCYNANAESMAEAIRFYGGSVVKGKKIFVLGDMLELGAASAEAHRKTGELVASEKPYAAFFVGKEMSIAYGAATEWCEKNGCEIKLFSEPASDDESVGKVAAAVKNLLSDGDLVLVKGSRGLQLERIVSVLCDEAEVHS